MLEVAELVLEALHALAHDCLVGAALLERGEHALVTRARLRRPEHTR